FLASTVAGPALKTADLADEDWLTVQLEAREAISWFLERTQETNDKERQKPKKYKDQRSKDIPCPKCARGSGWNRQIGRGWSPCIERNSDGSKPKPEVLPLILNPIEGVEFLQWMDNKAVRTFLPDNFRGKLLTRLFTLLSSNIGYFGRCEVCHKIFARRGRAI